MPNSRRLIIVAEGLIPTERDCPRCGMPCLVLDLAEGPVRLEARPDVLALARRDPTVVLTARLHRCPADAFPAPPYREGVMP